MNTGEYDIGLTEEEELEALDRHFHALCQMQRAVERAVEGTDDSLIEWVRDVDFGTGPRRTKTGLATFVGDDTKGAT